MDPNIFLTGFDRRRVQEFLDAVQALPLSLRYSEDEEVDQAPEFHLVKIPAEGVPAMACPGDSTGTGTEGSSFVPGVAECEVWRKSIVSDGSNVLEDAGFTIEALNMNTDPIEADVFAAIMRDKFGTWFIAEVFVTDCP